MRKPKANLSKIAMRGHSHLYTSRLWQQGYERLEEMAQSAKCLPWKHEELSLIPRTPVNKLSMVACTCNFMAGELEKGGFLELAGQQSGLLGDYVRISPDPPPHPKKTKVDST